MKQSIDPKQSDDTVHADPLLEQFKREIQQPLERKIKLLILAQGFLLALIILTLVLVFLR